MVLVETQWCLQRPTLPQIGGSPNAQFGKSLKSGSLSGVIEEATFFLRSNKLFDDNLVAIVRKSPQVAHFHLHVLNEDNSVAQCVLLGILTGPACRRTVLLLATRLTFRGYNFAP